MRAGGAEFPAVDRIGLAMSNASGRLLLPLPRALRIPVVTTLHTVLGALNEEQRAVREQIAAVSERLLVISAHVAELLTGVHHVPAARVDLIPHGSPVATPTADAKERLGLDGRAVLLSFGLLSRDTGIFEHVRFDVPRREDGYCLDDNACALLLITGIDDSGTDERAMVHALSGTYLAFVSHACNDDTGAMPRPSRART